ncbi:MAG: hypothetical protein ACI4XR_04830 [Bacilli bacterium]
MNVEYLNLNNNLYAVTNEDGQINVIKSVNDPERLLNLYNNLERKISEKNNLYLKIEKKNKFLLIKDLLQILFSIILILNLIINFYNIPILLLLISLWILTNIILNCLLETDKKNIEQVDLLTEQIHQIEDEINNILYNIHKLTRENEYQYMGNYERYLKENDEKTLEKSYVRKLSLKR